ncbi:MAG TPA: ABC transporter substrate-binding protein [Trebonia sp.]|nr:ABC transporter substrate-binding protein [Trebonia sp.]
MALAAAAAAGCGAQPPAHHASTNQARADMALVVAAVPASGASGLYIAQTDGLFRAAGLRVTIESAASAADVVPALLSGSVNVALGQWTSALAAAQAGVQLTAIAPGNSGAPGLEELVTGRRSRIASTRQLAGQTIAVNALSGLTQALAENALAAAGVRPGQVRFTAVPFPDMAIALAKGEVGAAFMIQPYLTADKAQVRELQDIDSGTSQGFPLTGYFSARSWAEGHQAALAAFGKALARGQQIAATDRAAVNAAMIRYTGVSAATASVMALGTFPSSVQASQLERVADLMKRYGLLPATASTTALADGLVNR